MNFIRHICRDTFDKCLVMLHPKQPNKSEHEYSNVSIEMKEDVTHHEDPEEDEDNENDFAAWPTKNTETVKDESSNTKESTKMSQSTVESEPSTKEKRPVLIGNIEEESLTKKKDLISDKDVDDVFMDLGISPTIEIKKSVVDNKKASKPAETKDRLDKFKMDDELEPTSADGWIDDNEINI